MAARQQWQISTNLAWARYIVIIVIIIVVFITMTVIIIIIILGLSPFSQLTTGIFWFWQC